MSLIGATQEGVETTLDEEACSLRARVVEALRGQGFEVDGRYVRPPGNLDKARIRDLNATAVRHKRAQVAKTLKRKEDSLLQRLANGHEITEATIRPTLVEVKRGTEDELLFRYASLHWSIPVSSGYGRRLRMLVVDQNTGKLVGLIGLCDPVINLGVRDGWIGWSASERSDRLRNVLDAFVLGAVPPYSLLLGGKLVAMLAASDEVRERFREKYQGRDALISHRKHSGEIVMLTTTSALGRSSVYNRLRFNGRPLYQSVGMTGGSGEFHFANGLYAELRSFAEARTTPTAKKRDWGKGFRNRREVIKKCLPLLGFSWTAIYHGVQREAFVIPLVHNVREFLLGQDEIAHYRTLPSSALTEAFHSRWLDPRPERLESAQQWNRDEWRLWEDA